MAPEYKVEYREEARRRIIDAGLRAFTEKGYRYTTMDDIAQEMGVSKGTLYLYFRTKEQLFGAIGERFQKYLKDALKSFFAEGITRGFPDIVDEPSFSREDLMRLWADMASEASRNESLRKIIAMNVENRIQMIRQFLAEQRKTASISVKGDLHSKSIAMLTLLIGTLFLRLLQFDETELKKVTKKSLNAILQAE